MVGLLLVINCLYACEEGRVLVNLVFVFHQQGLDLFGSGLHLVVAVAFQNVEEEVGDTAQLVARAVERDHGVLEIRCGRVVGNLRHLRFRSLNRFLKSRQVMFGFDIVKRRGLPRGGPLLG